MPRIAENLDRCVFFLFGHSPKTGQLIGPGATGFFVGKSSESLDYIIRPVLKSDSRWIPVRPPM